MVTSYQGEIIRVLRDNSTNVNRIIRENIVDECADLVLEGFQSLVRYK